GKHQRYRNIMITMLLGGLWHGATWTFVAWGFFHGIIITATHFLSSLSAFAGFVSNKARSVSVLKWAITLYLVLIGWVLFRANSIGSAWDIVINLHTFAGLPEQGPIAGRVFAVTVIALIWMHLQDWFVINKGEAFERKKWLFWPVLIFFQGLCLMTGEPSSEFIYFQF
ncbi:MAG: MBOAT family protein, partial [Pseudomonadota bacterium]